MTLLQQLTLAGYKIVNPFRRTYWFIFRPETKGAKCLIENDGEFLLARLNYAHRQWTLPGGGVHRGETFKDAAVRETREEVGIDVSEPVLIGSYRRDIEYKKDTVEVYFAEVDTLAFKLDPVEIKEAAWFRRDSLPQDRQPSIDTIFGYYDEFRSKKN